MLCLLTRGNLMLEGPPGVAKTLIADLLFSGITDARLYAKQFMKGTVADEVFGPIFSEKYRKEGVWEHNTDGMLPEAHLAILDEVYWASDMLLPSMLGILNEHRFHNGAKVQDCPLITALATCNFETDDKRLEAFKDRWLITVKVSPIDNASGRLTMMQKFLDRLRNRVSRPEPLTLEDLRRLQRKVITLTYPEQVLELFDDAVSRFRQRSPGVYISDRRMCNALLLAGAATIMENPEATEVSPEALTGTRMGIAAVNTAPYQEYEAQLTAVIGDYSTYAKESRDMDILTRHVMKLKEEYDDNLPPKRKARLKEEVRETLLTLTGTPIEERPVSAKARGRLDELTQEMSNLAESIGININLAESLGININMMGEVSEIPQDDANQTV